MPAYPDADLTLPSVVAALHGSCRERDLLLTVIFHPCASRIGETAIIPRQRDAVPLIVGRRSPVFARGGGGPGCPLDEAHVSRQAIALVNEGDTVTLRRLPASSRCRVGGRELNESIELGQAQLDKGVPMLLGHSVVLLLRRVLRHNTDAAALSGEHGLLGESRYMASLHEQIDQVAASDLDVLIRGETGTGKELVAAAIHRASGRCSGPFICVNMAAIPPGLAVATLFGSARGAFTGASVASEGYFRQADGGTLFLDEIGDTPPEVQPQLLRALQQREVQAVGGAIHRVNVRVISATDAALEEDGCDFKAALRHRLGAFDIRLQALREHPEDIGILLGHFLQIGGVEAGFEHLLPGEHATAPEISGWAELFHSFLCYDWPGNVRELGNFSRQVALASGRGLTLPDSVGKALQEARQPAGQTIESGERALRRITDVGEAEFQRAWQAGACEVAATARQLGVSRQAVYRRVEDSPQYRLAGQVSQVELEAALARHDGEASAAAIDLQVSLSGLQSRLRASGLAWR